MSVPVNQTAFVAGEVTPSLFGHVDLARMHSAASTMRNMWPSVRGGAYSRAGTAFVGFSKQTGRAFPPRLIPFEFSIDQGLALEFGNFYMRVVSDGAFVTEIPIPITAATRANPIVVTRGGTTAAASAVANVGAVSTNYLPGDSVTLAGGVFSMPTTLRVATTQIVSLALNNPGTSGSYAGAEVLTLHGGTQSSPAQITVTTTQIASAVLNSTGTGGTPGPAVLSSTTGTGTPFQLNVTIGAGGHIVSVDSIADPGSFTVNPTLAPASPVSGGGLGGSPSVIVRMVVQTFSVTAPGTFIANAPGGTFTQGSNTGAGLGATFHNALFGPNDLTVTTPGFYTTYPANPVAQASSTGGGLGATYTVSTATVAPFVDGDWVFFAGVGGMTQLNGNTYVVTGSSGLTFSLRDVYGTAIDSTAYGTYTSGGTAARIFTLDTIYAEEDLPWLKFTQSKDVMSLCCVNQMTQMEYVPQDLARFSDTNWVFSGVVAEPSVDPPASLAGVASSSGTVTYDYVVTSVSPIDGSESIASPVVVVDSAVDIAATAGTITLTWTAVSGVAVYYVYKATPAYDSTDVPIGAAFGFAGFAYGTQFIDSNIVADFTQVPPNHINPFVPGQISRVNVLTGGSGLTESGTTYTINTATGTDAVLELVVISGALAAALIIDPGQDYALGDTITFGGTGSGATGVLVIGPQSGTYPSVPGYDQERRVYADTLNNPDTYWMSQPGAFTNFDSRIPPIASDAITGTPWSLQVNGIQFLLLMPGGLLAFTGLGPWQVTGQGSGFGSVAAITPSSQQATPQAANGCSATVPPIRIYQQILYVQAKNSSYLDLTYQIYANIYGAEDISINSNHLFNGYTILEHAYCDEPYKILWAVRNDGVLLSLTYLKPQQVQGWAHHDTNGSFVSVCTVTEPPVDALYVATQRFPGSNTCYMIERMDDRIWNGVEETWCVDAGLSLPQPAPNATLTASSATGAGACTGVTGLVGGTGWSSATTLTIVDAPMQPNGKPGPGAGAGATPTFGAGGTITAVTISPHGAGYLSPEISASDPTNGGSGFSATVTLDNGAIFTASGGAPFASGDVGSIIRMGGGIARITAYTSSTVVTANIFSPILQTRQNSGTPPAVMPQPPGAWTMTAPVTTISGLVHLAGATVTGIADGNIITPRVVSPTGTITLDQPASAVTIGLGFQAQLQSVYLEAGELSAQGARKKVASVTARIEGSRGLKAGSNQPDASTQSPIQVAAPWANLQDVPDDGPNFPVKPYNALATPLRTGDIRIPIQGGYQTPGQVCLQQDNPMPMQCLSFANEILPGDLPSVKAPEMQQQRRG